MATDTAVIVKGDLDGKVAADNADIPELTAKEAKREEDRQNRGDLRLLERKLVKGRESIKIMAEALTQIRDRKLFRYAIDPDTGKGYKAFGKYCLSHPEWGFTAQYASQLIGNLRDQKAIEAGQEPEPREVRGPRPLTEGEAVMKIAKSYGQFAETISKYRDAVDNDAFRSDFDQTYAAMSKIIDPFIKRHSGNAPANAKTVSPAKEK